MLVIATLGGCRRGSLTLIVALIALKRIEIGRRKTSEKVGRLGVFIVAVPLLNLYGLPTVAI